MNRGAVIKVGCCGFPTSQHQYYRLFPLVELQSTFYRLPRLGTAARWRSQAPRDFQFCVKAWQVITHPSSSPTWKRIPGLKNLAHSERYGQLRPTRENFDAWEKTLEICRILQAPICVVQSPPSLGFSRRNLRNIRRFMREIDRRGMKVAWEPRGTWKAHCEQIRKLCDQLDLIHVVDVLRCEPATVSKTCYFRLHGLGPGEVNYKYNYTPEDLRHLLEVALGLLDRGAAKIFVMFNNTTMLDNASALQRMWLTSKRDLLAKQVLSGGPD